MTEKRVFIVARDSRDRWCASMLNKSACGTEWLALEEGVPEEQIAIAMFVFLGEGPPHMLARIRIVARDIIESVGWMPGLESAVTLDELIDPPDWIRKAAS